MTDRPPPEGFEPFTIQTGFIGVNGPLYVRRTADRLDMGFWVEERHCNMMRGCHGGWLASFADIQLAGVSYRAANKSDSFFATINLSIDYLAAAPLGSWVEGRAEVLRVTRNVAFSQMTATADGKPCFRASGIFKV